VSNFRIQEKSLPGNVLLVTAFVSYVGCFTKRYRNDLLQNFWMPKLQSLKVIDFEFFKL
jgi:dynein heavy chain